MIECGFYNIDCMEGLKEMPDKSVDEDYYRMAKERLDAAEAQVNIFDFM